MLKGVRETEKVIGTLCGVLLILFLHTDPIALDIYVWYVF